MTKKQTNKKKCNWVGGGRKLKSLVRFHSANEIDNYNRGGKKGKRKGEKNPEKSTEQIKK